jgi:hypothetical protein
MLDWEPYRTEMAAWNERQAAYRERTGLAEKYAEIRRRVETATASVAAAEERSMTIC